MTKVVRPSSFAQEEIEHYIRRYESESPGLGEKLWTDVQNVVTLIASHPAAGEPVRRTRGAVRRVPLRRFPFFVIYRDRGDHLQLVALAHTSRRPGYWRARLSDV